MKKKKSIEIKDVDAAIFDLDGVITDTASVHARAWKTTFDAFLEARDKDFKPFDIEKDYHEFIDGKPRHEGVKSFLQSRDIELPAGSPKDEGEKDTVHGLGNRKNALYNELLEKEGFTIYKDAVERLKQWKAAGIKTAIVSSSKNCKKVLELAQLEHLFNVRVDGVTSEELNLKGKPEPDIFLEAVKRLHVVPQRAVIFEDAIAGVKAGAQGKFACVVGVERKQRKNMLKQHGATEIITSFREIDILVESLPQQFSWDKITSALEHAPEISNKLASKTLCLFISDEVIDPPEESKHEKDRKLKEVRDVLKTLAHHAIVAIIGEHDLSDLKEKLKLNSLYYAGCKGLDISGPDMKIQLGKEAIPQLDQLQEALKANENGTPAPECSRKRLLLLCRLSEDEKQAAAQKAYCGKLVAQHDRLRLDERNGELFIHPKINWNKAKTLGLLLEEIEPDETDLLPVYLGNEKKDEEVFHFLFKQGLGIKVGDDGLQSFAKYKLSSFDEVSKFLYVLSDIITKEPAYNWKIVYDHYEPKKEALREALCTLGNGYFASRGAAEEMRDDGIHYPGTYLAGGYNRAETIVSGKVIENEDLVNFPNWLSLSFRAEGGDWFSVDEVEILDYQQLLDLRKGVLERRIRFCDGKDRETEIIARRFVSQKNPHLAGICWKLEAKNWSGKVEVRSAIDGSVTNNGVKRYRDLEGRHLNVIETGMEGEQGIYLLAQTRQSRLYVAEAARTIVFRNDRVLSSSRKTHAHKDGVEQIISFELEKLKPVSIEKIVSVFTSRDASISEPVLEVKKLVSLADSFDHLLKESEQRWEELWNRFDMTIDGSIQEQMILRLHIFHLLQTVSLNSIPLDIGVPARGWHGEAYRGHIFWDEIFIFPFINLRQPELSRSLLMYRYRRLEEARSNARQSGYRGAMYPWQSGSNGREESQSIHLNPQSGQWLPDNTFLQRHISADIVFNVMQYYEATADEEFMNYYGAEIVLDVANFFSSLAQWSDDKQRYEICHVAGPDEYHTHYSHSDDPGIDNNAYTNIMASWVLKTATSLLGKLEPSRKKELLISLKISEEDLIRWDKVARELYVPFIGERIINQFEGYEQLQELDWDKYHKKHGQYLRLDRILQAEGDDVNRYKASKQADVLMLFYLFTYPELQEIFDHLNYPFDRDMIYENIAYYEARTSHGSTLSQLVHSWVLARSDRNRSWHSFKKALISDFKDVQGGTTPEGIHLGAMAGTVDLVQRCYGGITVSEGKLLINPLLPENLNEVVLRIQYRANWIDLKINHKKLSVHIVEGWGNKITIGVHGQQHTMKVGDSRTFNLQPHTAGHVSLPLPT